MKLFVAGSDDEINNHKNCILSESENTDLRSFITLTFIAFGISSSAQQKDLFSKDIEKNIFRTTISFIAPDDEGLPILFSYEREIRKPFTIVLSIGPSFRGLLEDGSQKIAIHAFASGELRYYFNLLHRIKNERTVRNFSATYLSFQESLLSGPIALINTSGENASNRKAVTFLNLGLQKQYKQGYLNLFLGPGLHFNDLDKGEWVMIDDFHVGISFGFVLFE